MVKYIIKRLLQFIPVLLILSFICFSISFITPVDVAKKALSGPYYQGLPDEEVVEAFRKEKGLDQPLHIQYFNWLKNVVTGDLGTSYKTNEPVGQDVISHFLNTLWLSLLSMFLALLFAIPIGIFSALRKGKAFDLFGRTFSLIGVSIPGFWLAYLLIILFSLKLGWLPVAGYGGFKYMLLPAVTSALLSCGTLLKLTRNSMIEVMEQDYIRSAEAKGLPKYKIILKHGLKNALIPVITHAGLTFATLLAGTAITEEIFGFPGIGHLMLDAINNQDFPLLQGCVLFVALTYLVINLIVDIMYMLLNPKIREGAI